MANVEFDNINKTYPNGFHAIRNLNLDVADGEFLILVGPSGCGKSTALRMVAGLEDVTDGDMRIGGRSVVDMAPKDRDIAMVFQNYALYPHMTVSENIGFSMKLARFKKVDIDARVLKVAKMLELEPHLQHKPSHLSGGQRQRVAMGRAMVREPAAFLMDEPLSNLDAKLRVQMRAEIAQLQKNLGITTLYVTHDQIEAMTMGDRVAVLKDGLLQQVGTPKNLYSNPVNAFVAGFIGSPSMNLFAAELIDRRLHFGALSMPIPDSMFERSKKLTSYSNQAIVFGIRPEDIFDVATHDVENLPTIQAVVTAVEELGAERIVHLKIDARTVDSGDPDGIEDLKDTSNAIARLDSRSTVQTTETIQVVIDNTKLHFFDPATHAAI